MKNRGKIAYVLQLISILPLLIFGIVILLLGSSIFTDAMYAEVEVELRNVSRNLITSLDALYPGDYKLVGETSYRLYKGDCDLTGDHSLIDRIKQNTGLDITLFYQDTRVLTTLFGKDGMRLVGSGAPDTVIEDVLKPGTAVFYNKVMIYGVPYFSYYVPLKNSDGSVAGMIFVGKPTADVDASVRASIYPLVIVDVIFMIVVSVIIFLYTRRFTSALMQIHGFLKEVSTGNLETSLPPEVLKRTDELRDIGRSALNMQRSLHNLIEQDALTSLANRRFGDQQLRQVIKDSASNHKDFCIAIGDVDDFKKINDTFGHDCGDVVLKNIAGILRRHMQDHGFAARWGGEEFLLIFKNTDLEKARQVLAETLEDIRAWECSYDDLSFRVTMTFGLIQATTDDMTELLRTADEQLYIGKNHGKNQIVYRDRS